MPAADLHASTGSLHIIKARGCLQWLHLCPSPHRLDQAPHADLSQLSFWTFFPAKREMGANEIYACMRWSSFWEEHMQFLWQKRAPFAPISIIFTTMSPTTQCHHFKSETVMNVHVHIVSKYTSVTPALTPSVLYISVIVLVVLSIAYNVCLLLLFLAICHYFNLLLSWNVPLIFKSKYDSKWAMKK